MGLFKRLFAANKAAKYYDHLPELPVLLMPVPTAKAGKIAVGQFTLEEQLAELSQARPKRHALLWQATDAQQQPRLLAFIDRGEENQKWLIDRLGGEELTEANWQTEHFDAKKIIRGARHKLVALDYQFELDHRFRLNRRVHGDDSYEIWQSDDKISKNPVLTFIIKPPATGMDEEFVCRRFQNKKTLVEPPYPGLLNVIAEGWCRPVGPFAGYRYKYKQLLYVVTAAPTVPFAMLKPTPGLALDWQQGMSILYQAGRLLACLHQDNWVCGRISPQHLWGAATPSLDLEPATVYLDGFALDQEALGANSVATVVHQQLGREWLPYLAPEQLRSSVPTSASDQYLLGLTVYHLLSGRNPIQGSSIKVMQQRLQEARIPCLHQVKPKIPKWFSNIVARMLASEPEQRFPDMIAMLTTLATRHSKAGKKTKVVATPDSAEPSGEDEFEEIAASPPPTPAREPEKKPVQEHKKSKTTGEKGDEKEYYLICQPYQPFRLRKHKKFHIGRDKSNDLILTSEAVSRVHVAIYWQDGAYCINDLQSSNGTLVNDEAISSHRLCQDDRIVIGGTSILFQMVARDRATREYENLAKIKQTLQMPVFTREQLPQSSMSGDLSQISIWQILQMLAAEEKTGCLIIGTEPPAHIFFSEGWIIHCEAGEQKGHEAFYPLLTCQQGRFDFSGELSPDEITMTEAVESLLLEGARRLDEQAREQ